MDNKHSDEPVPLGDLIGTPAETPRAVEVILSLWNTGCSFVLNEDVSDQPAGTRVMLRGLQYAEHDTWYTVTSESGVIFNARQSELTYAPLTPTP